jgi:D-alanyl-D-alanine carboxypeptidase/D-alanyl-D-alanine-endopeptidase (penicillin-binding protein 4)
MQTALPLVTSHEEIGKLINDKIQNVDPSLNVGIKIIDLKSGQIIYTKNSNRYYTPASLTKVFTLLALNEYFQCPYPFSSAIYLNQDKDRYYLTIDDPNFLQADLKVLLDMLAKQGIVLDHLDVMRQAFSIPPTMVQRSVDDMHCAYGAPITRVHVNKNICSLIAKSSKIGEKVTIDKDIFFPYDLNIKAITVQNDQEAIPLSIVWDGKQCTINGALKVGKEESLKLAIHEDDHYHYVVAMIKHFLPNASVAFQDSKQKEDEEEKVKNSTVPSDAIVSRKKSYADIAGIALKTSDNFIADYVLASYATQENQPTWDDATHRLREKINEVFQVDLTKSKMDDGSGLSRRNLFTVEQISDFLGTTYQKPNFNEMQSLMAYSQQDEGTTIAGRFPKNMRVYAKTGTLSGVSNLCGYVYPKQYETPYSFVITMNNFCDPIKNYRDLQDNIIKLFQ